ncbi:hypothetical protein GCM10011494_01240 [Novosphingobium endophyticum]|uniref:Uncharacterized protein n=1 Tax=Novosphingobium endophyticum TaxID=1955250 RepID=A0A916TPC0_9SPHN|nr:hypothetical protein GCM10011494_01240 [Novosphingobium endophyticum]
MSESVEECLAHALENRVQAELARVENVRRKYLLSAETWEEIARQLTLRRQPDSGERAQTRLGASGANATGVPHRLRRPAMANKECRGWERRTLVSICEPLR